MSKKIRIPESILRALSEFRTAWEKDQLKIGNTELTKRALSFVIAKVENSMDIKKIKNKYYRDGKSACTRECLYRVGDFCLIDFPDELIHPWDGNNAVNCGHD